MTVDPRHLLTAVEDFDSYRRSGTLHAVAADKLRSGGFGTVENRLAFEAIYDEDQAERSTRAECLRGLWS